MAAPARLGTLGPESLEVVGKMLGHKNYRTTQRYSHIADTALHKAVNKTAKTIIRAGQGRARSKPSKPSRRKSR